MHECFFIILSFFSFSLPCTSIIFQLIGRFGTCCLCKNVEFCMLTIFMKCDLTLRLSLALLCQVGAGRERTWQLTKKKGRSDTSKPPTFWHGATHTFLTNASISPLLSLYLPLQINNWLLQDFSSGGLSLHAVLPDVSE